MGCCVFFFFFQAEDGIRDADVTEVQTCALPIFEAAANETERRFLRGLAIEAFAAEENRAYADEVFRRLEEFRLTRVIDQLKGTLQRMNPVERPDEYTRFFEALIALEARRRALREPRSGGDSPPLPRST